MNRLSVLGFCRHASSSVMCTWSKLDIALIALICCLIVLSMLRLSSMLTFPWTSKSLRHWSSMLLYITFLKHVCFAAIPISKATAHLKFTISIWGVASRTFLNCISFALLDIAVYLLPLVVVSSTLSFVERFSLKSKRVLYIRRVCVIVHFARFVEESTFSCDILEKIEKDWNFGGFQSMHNLSRRMIRLVMVWSRSGNSIRSSVYQKDRDSDSNYHDPSQNPGHPFVPLLSVC